MMKTKNVQIGLALFAIMFVSATYAQMPGDVDPDFGISGYVLNDFIDGKGEVFVDMITLSDDKIIMVGYTDYPDVDILVAKFNADGSIDESFGIPGLGYTTIDASLGGPEQAYAVKELASGKLLITGYISNGLTYDGFIMRLNSDGIVDDSFGETASGRTNFNAGDNYAALGRGIEVLSDNSILVGASILVDGQADMAVFKFSQGGALVVAFASGGSAIVDIDGEDDETFSMAINASEHIFLCGRSEKDGIVRGIIVELSQFGTPTTFNTTGYYLLETGGDYNEINNIVIDGTGRVVGTGDAGTYPDLDGVIVRLKTDGTPDESFGTGGLQFSDPGATVSMYLMNVFLTGENGILVTGFTDGPTTHEVYAFMMKEDGTPNSDFGSIGDINLELPISTVGLNSSCAALQSNEEIVLGGFILSEDFVGYNMFMMRLSPMEYETIGIENIDVPVKQINVYPNPVTESFSMQLNATEALESIELITLQGEVAYSWNARENAYVIPANIANGNYFVKTKTNDAIYVSRIAIIH